MLALKMLSLLVAIVPVVGCIVGKYLFRSNTVFAICGKNSYLTVAFFITFIIDISAIFVIPFTGGFYVGYLIAFVIHLAVLAVTYWWVNYNYHDHRKYQGSKDISRINYDIEVNGWISDAHIKYFFGFILIDLVLLYIPAVAAKMFFPSFSDEVYTSLLSLVLVVVSNLIYRFWIEPADRIVFEGRKVATIYKTEINQ